MKINPKISLLIVFVLGLCGPASIAAAAEQNEIQNSVQAADSAPLAGASEKQVEIQFGGSLCAVCLNAFKGRLLTMPGIKTAEIIVDKANPKSGRPPKVAHAFIGYDPEQVSKESLIDTFKRNDFQFIAAKDK